MVKQAENWEPRNNNFSNVGQACLLWETIDNLLYGQTQFHIEATNVLLQAAESKIDDHKNKQLSLRALLSMYILVSRIQNTISMSYVNFVKHLLRNKK